MYKHLSLEGKQSVNKARSHVAFESIGTAFGAVQIETLVGTDVLLLTLLVQVGRAMSPGERSIS